MMQNDPGKYDIIGSGYNTTRRADPYLLSRLLFHLDPTLDGAYLDIGCGTGNYTIPIAAPGFHFTGVDPSARMLNEAKRKSSDIHWIEGTAEDLPFPAQTFDGAMATLTVHHWKDREHGLREVLRVLHPGSRFVIFTSSPDQMDAYWLNHYFPIALQRSIENMPAAIDIVNALYASGFDQVITEKYFVRDDLQDLFLQSGKNRPEIYFDEHIRKGISTFASLATTDEIERGLQKLRYDLDHDLFDDVRQRYESDHGDYMFIVAQKS